MKKNKFIDWIAIILLVVLNIIIKSVFLNVDNLDIDEPFTVYSVQGDFQSLISIFKFENNPPLFFILLHGWIKAFGIEPGSVRFLPMLFSALTVVFIYLIGKKYYSIKVALAACLLYTFSNLNMMEAHEARTYSLFVFLTTLSMYFYFCLTDSPNKKQYIIFLAITNALLIYSHVFGIFVLVLQGLYTLFIPSIRKTVFKEYFISSVIFLLLYLPYLIFIFSRLLDKANGGMPFHTSELSTIHTPLWSFTNYDTKTLLLFMAILSTFVLTSIVTKRKFLAHDIMIFGWFVIPYLSMFLISYRVAIFIPKYMIYITPGFYLVVAIAAISLSEQIKLTGFMSNYKWVIGVLLLLLCLYKMMRTTDLKASNYAGATDVVRVIKEHKSDSTIVYISPQWVGLTFVYYYNRNIFKNDYYRMNQYLNAENIFITNSSLAIDTLNLSKVSNVLFLSGEANGFDYMDPEKKMYASLAKRNGKTSVIAKLTGYTIYEFIPN